MGEHGGTHIDAPMHMWKSGWSVDEIPLDRLLNLPLVVVDVTKKVEEEPNYAVCVFIMISAIKSMCMSVCMFVCLLPR